MDGHDWTHDHFEHPDHDAFDLPDEQPLAQEHGFLEDLISDDHQHGLLDDHAVPDFDQHAPEDHGALPADEISLEPEPAADAAGFDPPMLEVSISPADGQDWVDPGLLGGAAGDAGDVGDLGPEPAALYAAPDDLLSSLHAAEGSDTGADWDSLAGSDDPAVRALAEFWRPQA